MGLGELTRKGWKKDPRKQGKDNLSAAIFSLIVGNTICYFAYGEIIPIGVDLLILAWGIIGYFLGLYFDRQRKR